jgi:hypothetical protein
MTTQVQPSASITNEGLDQILGNTASLTPEPTATPFDLGNIDLCSSILFSVQGFDDSIARFILDPVTMEQTQLADGFVPVSFSPSGETLLLVHDGDLYLADHLGDDPVLIYKSDEVYVSYASRWLDENRVILQFFTGTRTVRGTAYLDLSSGNEPVPISGDKWRIFAVSRDGTSWIEGIVDYTNESRREPILVFPDGSKIPLWEDYIVLYFDISSSLSFSQIDFLPDGRGAVFSGYELPYEEDSRNRIYISEFENGIPSRPPYDIFELPRHAFVDALSVSPNGEFLAIRVQGTGPIGDYIGILDLTTFEMLNKSELPYHPFASLLWSPNSRYLALQSRSSGYVDHLLIIDPFTGGRATLLSEENVFIDVSQWSPACLETE